MPTDPRPRVGAIVQARMGSTRLPGKVLLPAAGRPLLEHLLGRLALARSLPTVIVATSTDVRDDAIEALCRSLSVPVFRGSEKDVLDRYHGAAAEHGLDVIVRVTADCPLIDPELIDEWVAFALAHLDSYDLVTNRHPLTFPDGLDFDVMSRRALEHVWTHASTPEHREHTVPYFWESGMRVHNFEDPDNRFLRHRWTLDYPEDYTLIRHIIEALDPTGAFFGTSAILSYLNRHPEISRINAEYLPMATAGTERRG